MKKVFLFVAVVFLVGCSVQTSEVSSDADSTYVDTNHSVQKALMYDEQKCEEPVIDTCKGEKKHECDHKH